MKTSTMKTASALFGAAMMATAGIADVAPAFADEVLIAEAQDLEIGQKSEQAVEGEFSFTQEKVTGMGVFAKAAAAACASLPEYAVDCTCWTIALASGDTQLISSVKEMMADGEVGTHIMGCSCASNSPAGGAVANAEVSGVSLESVAAMVDAL